QRLSNFSKTIFESHGHAEFFTCVEYSPSAGYLVTGGTDGLLRVWFPHKSMSCEQELCGHVRPITHIMYNGMEKTFISLSDDKMVHVWSENGWVCRQSFQAEGMGRAPISSVCLNRYNNELVLANSDIGKCLGRGTDVFRDTLTTHDKPLCSAFYHSIFKQVVSICQNGVVTVWDITTGKAVMEFNVTPHRHVGFTAISLDEPQRRLLTVSQDGKVRLWNFNNGTELGRSGSLPVDKRQNNVKDTEIKAQCKKSTAKTVNSNPLSPLILCLKTRATNVHTATLLTSADGFIYAWSVKSNGGLLGKFKAVNDEGAVITTMSTD
uniref:WD repeat-containing protein on Y chromosome n=1 Tax=Dicentrarchus labrax TaxID=13489 RepID=A0A8P4KBH7_DICLA